MTQTLSNNPNDGMMQMIQLGLKLKGVLLAENRSVVEQKADDFGAALQNKEEILQQYETAAAEFKTNLSTYKTADKELLMQLKTLQEELSMLSQKSLDLLKVVQSISG